MTTYLYEVCEIADYDVYYQMKSEKDAIKYSGFADKPDYEQFKQYFIDRILNNPNCHIFFMRDRAFNDEIIGYCGYEHINNELAEGHGTGIFKKYSGQGYASELDILLFEEVRRRGYKKIESWVSSENTPSINALIDAGAVIDYDRSKDVHMKYFCKYHTFYYCYKEF